MTTGANPYCEKASGKQQSAGGFLCALLPAAFCLAFPSCLPLLAGESISTTIAGLQRRYSAVNSIKANFRQTYTAPGVEQVESGVFWMKKPGLMRWEYRDPETRLFVTDGHETYLYTPEERQVMVSSFSSSERHGTPLQFLLGEGNISASFEASFETESKPWLQGTVLLRLTPRSLEPDYSYILLEIDAGTYDVRRIVIRERKGNSSQFLLTDMETNVKVENGQFRFKIPKGVEIIRLDEKD
ncbi:MAG TPA: outer membrane lipoprotein carrier protein LolA [Acidobacteriota bacterium]|nr:outer membrane lipoprotein carrier protein LolA [Acidobacteriota bacterium]